MLCLLSGAMGYSLLSLAVHVVDRSVDKALTTELSLDGGELLQLRSTGMAVLDIETGKIMDEVRFVSRWRNAFIPQERRFELANWDSQPQKEVCKRFKVVMTKNAEVIAIRISDEGVMWWNRRTGVHHVLTSPRTEFLDLSLNEEKDRLYVQCCEIAADPFTKLPPAEAEKQREPHRFDAVRDIRVYELRSGKFLLLMKGVRVGLPVQNDREKRVFADAKVKQLKLVQWQDFPEGEPELVRDYALDEVILKRLDDHPPEVVRMVGEELGFQQFDVHLDHPPDRSKIEIYQIATSGNSFSSLDLPDYFSSVQVLDSLEGYLVIRRTPQWYSGKLPPSQLRLVVANRSFVFEKFDEELIAGAAWSGRKLSNSQLRLASDRGDIVDLTTAAPEMCRHRRIALTPHSQLPLLSLAPLGVVAILWLVYGTMSRTLLSNCGWLINASLLIWPVILFGIERGYSADGLRVQFTAIALTLTTMLLLASTTVIFFRGSKGRSLCLIPWLVLSLLISVSILPNRNPKIRSIEHYFGILLPSD